MLLIGFSPDVPWSLLAALFRIATLKVRPDVGVPTKCSRQSQNERFPFLKGARVSDPPRRLYLIV